MEVNLALGSLGLEVGSSAAQTEGFSAMFAHCVSVHEVSFEQTAQT